MFDSHGDIGASAGGQDGLFDCDTRYLSHLELLIDGVQPLLLHSAIKDDNLNYYVDLTNPDIYADGKIVLLKDTVHISRTIYLCDGSLRERIGLMNHGAEPVSFTLSLAFASDFADIFEVRGIKRERRGPGLGRGSGAERRAPVLPRPGRGVARDDAALRAGADRCSTKASPPTLSTSPRRRSAPIFVTVASRGRLPEIHGIVLPGAHRAQARAQGGDARTWRPSRPPTRSSTRSCAARWRTSTC